MFILMNFVFELYIYLYLTFYILLQNYEIKIKFLKKKLVVILIKFETKRMLISKLVFIIIK